MSILQNIGVPRLCPLYKNGKGCPGVFCPTLAQIIKGQMQLNIGWLQLGRTYYILVHKGFMLIHLGRDMLLPTMWYFDKCRRRRACAAPF